MAAKPKGKNISLPYYWGPLSDEKSAATVSRRDFNERARWRESLRTRWQDDRQFFYFSWPADGSSATAKPVVRRQIPA